MSEPKKSLIRRAGVFILGYLTPWRSISRSASSVSRSMGNIADAARAARDSMRAEHERIEAAKQVQLTPEQLRMTPGERFADDVRRLDLSESALAWRATQFRRAKWACMLLALISLAGSLYMMTVPHPILSFVIGPVMLLFSLIMVLKGTLEAWKQAQIELRQVFDFKGFASRQDFFKRLVV